MGRYVDLYLLPVPRRNLAAYRRMAIKFGEVIRDHGVLEYREFVASGAKPMPGMKGVESVLKPRKGEVLVFSVVGFKSKAHRDRVNQKTWNDPRLAEFTTKKTPFDMKRMLLSEFETLVGSPS